MRITLLSLASLAVLALAACKDERPPRWGQVCVATEDHISVMLLPGANGSLQTIPYVDSRCVRHEWQCLVGDDFQGERQCPPRQVGFDLPGRCDMSATALNDRRGSGMRCRGFLGSPAVQMLG